MPVAIVPCMKINVVTNVTNFFWNEQVCSVCLKISEVKLNARIMLNFGHKLNILTAIKLPVKCVNMLSLKYL